MPEFKIVELEPEEKELLKTSYNVPPQPSNFIVVAGQYYRVLGVVYPEIDSQFSRVRSPDPGYLFVEVVGTLEVVKSLHKSVLE